VPRRAPVRVCREARRHIRSIPWLAILTHAEGVSAGDVGGCDAQCTCVDR
jgi:hypothetical protein